MTVVPSSFGFVVVTGAARRIGRAIALRAAREGWDVVVHANASMDDAQNVVREIEGMGRRAFAVRADLTEAREVAALMPGLAARVEALGGVLRGLVNNASLFLPDAQDPDGARMRALHIDAPKKLMEDLYRLLPEGETGVVVNMLDGTPYAATFKQYGASKDALREATFEMAVAYAPRLRVNAVAPGPTICAVNETPAHFQTMIENTLLRRASNVEDVADGVCFLLRNASVTGVCLAVNCGG